ncbi:kinase domain-containing protein, partial [Aduncisulcus paluster]
PSKSGAYLVFPYYARGDMTTWLRTSSPSVCHVRQVLKCVLHALSFLHEHGIVHCDLKPQNVLIDDACNGLLCDFEGAVDCGERTIGLFSKTLRLGTPTFIAPELELALKEHRHPHPSPASDMFSFGVLVQDVFGALDGVCMPAEVHSICAACVSEHPRDRPTARQVLTHKWFL